MQNKNAQQDGGYGFEAEHRDINRAHIGALHRFRLQNRACDEEPGKDDGWDDPGDTHGILHEEPSEGETKGSQDNVEESHTVGII